MDCKNCGAKNESKASFCYKCGNKLNKNFNNKLYNLPKNTKLAMVSVLGIVLVAVIILSFLLQNPVKKVEDYLLLYYDNYTGNKNQELVEIGRVLVSNKNNEKVLNNIKNTVQKSMSKWVKNFNIEYKNENDLSKAYYKVYNSLKDIYDYFDGLEYMLNRELYEEYKKELNTLYYSKSAYFEGLSYEKKNDDYYAYFYYQKVEETDVYYGKANLFVANYVKDEVNELKKKADAIVKVDANTTLEEKLDLLLKKLEFLEENKKKNNVDLSNTSIYKEIYDNNVNEIIDVMKKMIEEFGDKNEEIIELINKVMDKVVSSSDKYQELEDLKKEYENKLPESLLEKDRNSYKNSKYSKFDVTINDKEYDSYLSFALVKENASVVYKLNKEYKKLKGTIIKSNDWIDNLSGTLIIYGDNKEIYKSSVIDKNSEDLVLDLDVSEVQDLKIEFVNNLEEDSLANYNIYLVEPYLYK